jgi:alanine-synthesizing transaminase
MPFPRDFYRVRRLPPYVLSQVVQLKHEARRAGEDIVDMGMGNPDQPPPPEILEHLHRAIDNPRNHRYSLSRGLPKLRLAITDWYQRRFGVTLDPETEAIATIGAKEGVGHLMLRPARWPARSIRPTRRGRRPPDSWARCVARVGPGASA